MVFSRSVTRGDDGAIVVGGIPVQDLAAEFGTPLYIVDEADMRARAAEFRDHFAAAFGRHHAKVDVYYASKAMLTSRIARLMYGDDLCIDVASLGYLEIDLRVGTPG